MFIILDDFFIQFSLIGAILLGTLFSFIFLAFIQNDKKLVLAIIGSYLVFLAVLGLFYLFNVYYWNDGICLECGGQMYITEKNYFSYTYTCSECSNIIKMIPYFITR